MKEITLYFVGFYKHDSIQGIFDGPFLEYIEALEARDLREDPRFEIVRVVLPVIKFEILS